MLRSLAVLYVAVCPQIGAAQAPEMQGGVVGRVIDGQTGAPVTAAAVIHEASGRSALSDSAGRYELRMVPPGPAVLRVERLGYAVLRMPVVIPPTAAAVHDFRLAASALQVQGITVTADAAGRARGELGTASVIGRDAIANQTAASLAGVLELVPGIVLSPPGLESVQQVALRAAPTSGTTAASELAAFGTLILLDGVPLSNNANLQTTGPRGELRVASSAGGGIDLRRIPAATIERVEVIRGVPSARFGDLTQGAIVIETRAGVFDPTLSMRFDSRTLEGSLAAGRPLGGAHVAAVTFDVARTRIAPGQRRDDALRLASQLAHRAELARGPRGDSARLVLDSRIDFWKLLEDSPLDSLVSPGAASWNRDSGLRFSERASLRMGAASRLDLTLSLSRTRQKSYVQALRIAPALPFTSATEEGRSFGTFLGGTYLSRISIDGAPWLAYARIEAARETSLWGVSHQTQLGAELRREWNAGPGYQFDMAAPPQVRFNGVRGFDRPRRYDDVPPVATSAVYLDSRALRSFGNASLDVQAGLRVDALHRGAWWFSSRRDAVLQPRINAQLSPMPWLRLRTGWGRSAKLPALGHLYPAPEFYDLLNVSWFANDPAERLAVITTFIRDATNPGLGFSVARKAEAGVELDLRGGSLSVVYFDDRVAGGVGYEHDPAYLLRDRYELADTVRGSGRPPTLLEPPIGADTVPIRIDRPQNSLRLGSRGWEMVALFPEIPYLRLRVEVQGALMESRLESDGVDFGASGAFSGFQLDQRDRRTPYWHGLTRYGRRGLLTTRVIHQQAEVGLVITATVQHTLAERQRDIGGRDTLAFEGYLTRAGELVPVPPDRRGDPEFADLRVARLGTLLDPDFPAPDWFMSLQVSKTLPLDGRLSFYAFNALDRVGRYAESSARARLFFPVRFGADLTLPIGALTGSRK